MLSHWSPFWLIIVPDARSGRSTVITPSTQGTRVSTLFDQVMVQVSHDPSERKQINRLPCRSTVRRRLHRIQVPHC